MTTKIDEKDIDELIRKISWIKNKGFYVFDENGEWLQKKINRIINTWAKRFT